MLIRYGRVIEQKTVGDVGWGDDTKKERNGSQQRKQTTKKHILPFWLVTPRCRRPSFWAEYVFVWYCRQDLLAREQSCP